MKNRYVMHRIIALSAAAAITTLYSGCRFGPNESISDEFARVSSQEVSNMSANSSTMIGSLGPAGSGKQAASAAGDTIYYDWKIYPYAWDAASGSYIRKATFTNLSDGYERERIDTVTFKDASGARLQHPSLATVRTIDHIRTVKRTKNGSALNIRVVMTSEIRLSPDTTHLKNGIITGTYDGETIGTGKIDNVTRQYTNGHWQFPRSGSVTADFPRRSYEVLFLGGGDAKLTVTNKATDVTRVVTIHVEER
jgi:hypothetical protein